VESVLFLDHIDHVAHVHAHIYPDQKVSR
jgi:hypothetical protein